MKISVSAKTKSKKEFVKKISDFSYRVAVKEEARDGKANSAIISALSEYFKIPKSDIQIVAGLNFKQKLIELPLTKEELEEIEEKKLLQPKLF